MIDALNKASNYDKRSIRDNLKFVGWVFVWMASLTVSDKAELFGWWEAEWITLLSIAINAGLGLWVVHCYRQMLKGMDDLQRKIQLEALSMAFGLSMVAACSYGLLVTWGYILDEEVSDIFFIMCMVFAGSVMINAVRYK